ncbi:MAG: cell division protein ZapE [Pseudoxanthomonas suwonensis]|nr:cell division protein ZapE [Pseudoxanthomonas suwonensis]
MPDTVPARPELLPSQRYAEGVARGAWRHDPAQQPALRELDRIHVQLLQAARPGAVARLLGRRAPTVRGLYLWGGVGRGKTFLIDLFHAGLPLQEAAHGMAGGKRRLHFHRFMREIHQSLREHAGERDPLAVIARQWRGLKVLVLDECFVNDIGDAMLLGRLLQRLFAEGVSLVTTSNIPPGRLYEHGLQRERFLPAIAAIREHCVELELVSDTDYRLRELTQSPVWRSPLDARSDAWLAARWQALGGDAAHQDAGITIEGRRIAVRARCPGMVWFDFAALCEGPRSASDYIEIAREFHTVLLGGIPVFDATMDDVARRFVNAIDEFYDRNVNLVATAAAEPVALYADGKLAFAFERTASRLIEMRSADYLAREHLP